MYVIGRTLSCLVARLSGDNTTPPKLFVGGTVDGWDVRLTGKLRLDVVQPKEEKPRVQLVLVTPTGHVWFLMLPLVGFEHALAYDQRTVDLVAAGREVIVEGTIQDAGTSVIYVSALTPQAA